MLLGEKPCSRKPTRKKNHKPENMYGNFIAIHIPGPVDSEWYCHSYTLSICLFARSIGYYYGSSCGTGGRAGRQLIRRSPVWSPAPLVYTLKRPCPDLPQTAAVIVWMECMNDREALHIWRAGGWMCMWMGEHNSQCKVLWVIGTRRGVT